MSGTRPPKRAISIVRGDTYSHVIVFQTSAAVAINITGRTYTAQIRTKAAAAESGTPVATFTCTVTNGAAGELTISLSSTLTDITPGVYVWDLQESNGGTITTFFPQSDATILQDITK